jgi:hypothetical protein
MVYLQTTYELCIGGNVVFWIFWIVWFFPRKYKYRCVRVYVFNKIKECKHIRQTKCTSICYLDVDVNWLIPKISACRARIWRSVASERSHKLHIQLYPISLCLCSSSMFDSLWGFGFGEGWQRTWGSFLVVWLLVLFPLHIQ